MTALPPFVIGLAYLLYTGDFWAIGFMISGTLVSIVYVYGSAFEEVWGIEYDIRFRNWKSDAAARARGESPPSLEKWPLFEAEKWGRLSYYFFYLGYGLLGV